MSSRTTWMTPRAMPGRNSDALEAHFLLRAYRSSAESSAIVDARKLSESIFVEPRFDQLFDSRIALSASGPSQRTATSSPARRPASSSP